MFKRFIFTALTAALVLGAGNAMAQETDAEPTVTINLTTSFMPAPPEVMYGFLGTEGDLEGVVNPDITVKVGDVVRIILTAGAEDPMEHDFALDEFGVHSDSVHSLGEVTEVSVTFTVTEAGTFEYYCAITGHREGGMKGNFIVEPAE